MVRQRDEAMNQEQLPGNGGKSGRSCDIQRAKKESNEGRASYLNLKPIRVFSSLSEI